MKGNARTSPGGPLTKVHNLVTIRKVERPECLLSSSIITFRLQTRFAFAGNVQKTAGFRQRSPSPYGQLLLLIRPSSYDHEGEPVRRLKARRDLKQMTPRHSVVLGLPLWLRPARGRTIHSGTRLTNNQKDWRLQTGSSFLCARSMTDSSALAKWPRC